MSNIPEFLPLFDAINDKSDKRIDEFLDLIDQNFNPAPPLLVNAAAYGTSSLPTLQNDVRLIAYAYLRSRKWNLKSALSMFRQSVAFRERVGADTMLLFPSPMSIRGFDEDDVLAKLQLQPRHGADGLQTVFNAFASLMKIGYHFYDKRGLPVVYWIIDEVNMKDAMKKVKQAAPVGSTLGDFTERCTSAVVETGWALCRYQDKVLAEKPIPGIETGSPRRNFVTVVVDCRGVSTKILYKPAIDILKDAIRRMNVHYADCIHRILMVNCPAVIRFVFSIIKPALNEGLQKKFTFVSPDDTAEALDRVIGKARVPSFLGGSCNCPGGCISCFNPNVILTAEEDNSDVVTENIKLSAGEKYQKVFEMVQGEDVVWDFVSTKGVDVRFSIYFYPKQDGVTVDKKQRVRIDKTVKLTTHENPLVSSSKLMDGADHYMAPVDGILQLVWDNSKSWMQDKPVQMRVYKSSPISDDSE